MADPRYQKPKQHSTSRLSNISGRNSSFYRDDDEELEQPQDKYDYELDEDDEDQDQDQEDDRYSYRRRNTQPHQQHQQETDDDDDDEEPNRQPKKRKLKSLMNYELAPRSNSQPGGSNVRNSFTSEWSERETFALLEAWGNRYLELGRKSLRSEDWVEVAENVSEVSKTDRLDTQCRNRLDTLKKNYKKEKAKMIETGGGGSRWVYFKKMDMLMTVSPKQECRLACGVDSGEYVFMNPKVYLNCANGFDEMRDSPGNSESFEGDDENDDDGGDDEERSSSVRMLAESIQKFSTIYEKIENSKRQQMMELEKMRLDFHNELELQNKQLLERVQTEIEKVHEDDNDGHNDNDDDDNGSGGNDDDDDNDDTDDASAENNLSV